MKIWPYDPARMKENSAHRDPITSKQIDYILYLRGKHEDIYEEVMDSVTDIEIDMNKAQAMYVIKCLLGQIKPVEITPDILRRILAAQQARESDASQDGPQKDKSLTH